MKGPFLAGSAAFFYAITIVIGRQLASAGLGSGESLGIRFATGAGLLAVVLVVARRPLLPAKGERLRAFALGAVGYAVESTFFYLALAEGTAGAVALLFYSYPALVAILEAGRDRRMPPRQTLIAVPLSATGTAVIVAGGGPLQISPSGVALALTAAVTFAVYLMAGDRWMSRTDPPTTALWVAFGASVSLLARAMLLGGITIPASEAPKLLVYGAATGAAFVCMFAALRASGGAQTAVVMTLEALFAVVLGAVFLEEVIGLHTVAGGAAVLAGAVLVSTGRSRGGVTETALVPEPLPRE